MSDELKNLSDQMLPALEEEMQTVLKVGEYAS